MAEILRLCFMRMKSIEFANTTDHIHNVIDVEYNFMHWKISGSTLIEQFSEQN